MHGRRQLALLGTGAIVTAALGISVTAYAASTGFDGTDGAGTIHACFVQSTGALRVVDTVSGATCKKGETPLAWAQSAQGGGSGSNSLIAALDDAGPYASPATTTDASYAHTDVVKSVDFTTTVGMWVSAVGRATDAGSTDISCPDADGMGNPGRVATSTWVAVDGHLLGAFTYYNDWQASSDPGTPALQNVWLDAGAHHLELREMPGVCYSGGTGTITVGDIHLRLLKVTQ